GHRHRRGARGDRAVRRVRARDRHPEEPVMKRIAIGVTLIVSILGLASADAQAPGKWVKLAPFPEPSEELYGAAAGGKFYVFGGATTHPGSTEPAVLPTRPHRSVGTVEEYDPATNTWRARSPMPTARNHAAIGVVNNKIYVIGGRVGAAFIGVASNTDVVE